MRQLPPLLALAATMAFWPQAAAAQDQPGDKVAIVDAYGDDPCPPSTDDTIVVCRRFDEGERFRIPENLRGDPQAVENQSWTNRVRSLETVGNTGALSCSPTGSGGYTGCLSEMIKNAYAERETGADAQAGRLVEEARSERLSQIDADAAAVQAREDEIAKELEASRAKREAAEAEMFRDAEASGAELNTEGLEPIDEQQGNADAPGPSADKPGEGEVPDAPDSADDLATPPPE